MARVFGLLFSGAVVRLAGAAAAIYVAVTVGTYVQHVFATVNTAMAVVQ